MKHRDLLFRLAGAGIVFGLLGGTLPASAVRPTPQIAFVDPMRESGMAPGSYNLSPLGMFASADGVVQSVIVVLLVASILTWAIGIAKWRELQSERRSLTAALRKVVVAPSLAAIGETGSAPLADMTVQAEDEIAASGKIGHDMNAEGIKDRIALRLGRFEAAQRRRIGRGVGVLAIVSSTAPFVGLFGTVWGIMNSFIGIAQSHTTNLAVVAPGIAEALLTTAVGLFAAIPAGILYNIFARALTVYTGELGDAGAAIMCIAGREIDRAEATGA